MKEQTHGTEQQHLRFSDIRGLALLASQATSGVTEIVEGVHRSVLDTVGLPTPETPGETPGITGLVYRSIHAVNRFSGKALNTTLAAMESLFQPDADAGAETLKRGAVLAALNGVMGDRMVEGNNPLAIPMTFRYQNETLDWQNMPTMSATSGKVVLLIHGLCMTDLQANAQLRTQMPDHGAALASRLGYLPIYLRYNSGLHTSSNGQELATQLEQLIRHWPTPIEELSIVAHSMGGLLARSAFHYANKHDLNWPGRVKNLVCLGTPHHGAPLERAGNWFEMLLGATAYSKPFAKLGRVRSAGITDLRYGHVVDEDWQDTDRFHRHSDQRQFVPLPAGVNCHTIAASTAEKRSLVADHLLGDGLVPLNSALGQHKDRQKQLSFADSSQWIAWRMNHMELLSRAEVTEQIVYWLSDKR